MADDPIIEAHRIVAEAETRVPVSERLVFAQQRGRRQLRAWWRWLRGWWTVADVETRHLVCMLVLVVCSELAARLVRPNGGS